MLGQLNEIRKNDIPNIQSLGLKRLFLLFSIIRLLLYRQALHILFDNLQYLRLVIINVLNLAVVSGGFGDIHI